MTDNSWGSPRLPTDPPLEFDNRPIAQAAWIKLVGPNPALRMLDFDIARDYCTSAEELQELEIMRLKAEEMRSELENMQTASNSKKPDEVIDRLEETLDRLYDRIEAKKAFMQKLYHEMHPDEPD